MCLPPHRVLMDALSPLLPSPVCSSPRSRIQYFPWARSLTYLPFSLAGICTVLATLVTLVVLAPQPFSRRECELCVVGITFGLLSAQSPALGRLPRT